MTLFGHKTGATLATALTASPKAIQYFSKVWASSGSTRFPGNPLEDSERANLEFAKAFPEVNSLSGWQTVSADALAEKIPQSWRKKHSNSLPAVDEESSSLHEWLVLDGLLSLLLV